MAVVEFRGPPQTLWVIMKRRLGLLTTLLPFLSLGGAVSAETLFNDQGLTAPCIGIGPVMTYCEHEVARQNFVPAHEAGVSGVTVGRTDGDDGVITAVAPGSAAARAGLVTGDAVVSVDDRTVLPTASRQVIRESFGPKGRTVRLTVKRGGETLERTIVLAAAAPPPGAPKSPNFLIGVIPS